MPPRAAWARYGTWLWLWMQRNDVTGYLAPHLQANGADLDQVGKFEIISLLSSGDLRQRQIVLQTLVELLKKYNTPNTPMEDQFIPFPEHILNELLEETKELQKQGTSATSLVIAVPSESIRKYHPPLHHDPRSALPRQSINPSPKLQIDLQ